MAHHHQHPAATGSSTNLSRRGGVCSPVPLPCDLDHWPRIKAALVWLRDQPSASGQGLVRRLDYLQRIFMLAGETGPGDQQQLVWEETAPVKRSMFVELTGFLDEVAGRKERERWLGLTLPYLVDKALDIERVKPARPLEYLRQFQECDVELSRPFIASLIACMFLCIIPEPSSAQKFKLNDLTFHRFFSPLRRK